MMMDNIGFIGSGRMASAIVEGLIRNGFPPSKIGLCSKSGNSASALSAKYGCNDYNNSLSNLMTDHSAVLVAIKPQQINDLPAHLGDLSEGKLILSVLAGIPVVKLKKLFPRAEAIVRIMPNTPGQIGCGISGFSHEKELSPSENEILFKVLSALGHSVKVREQDIDAVTGLSGSGPAYVFEFIAALRDGGIANGLDSDVAFRLAIETVAGATALLAHTGKTPEQLRDQVTSPNGTTLAGLNILQSNQFRSIIEKTVTAATKRSIELANG